MLFALLALFWGTSFVAIEVGLEFFPPVLFAAIRYGAAGAIVLAYAVATVDDPLPRTKNDLLAVATVGTFVIAGYHALLYLGELQVSGAVASVVVSLSPVLTAAFAAPLFVEEHLDRLGVAGLVAGFVGVAVVANPGATSMLSSSVGGLGLVLLGAASFAVGAVLTRAFDAEMPLRALEGWGMLLGSGVLWVVSLVRGESMSAIHWTDTAVFSLVYLTLVSGVVAFLIYFELLSRVGATEINLVGYLEPVVATAMSWLLLGHLVAASTLAGFVAIFAGFALLKHRAVGRFLRSVPLPTPLSNRRY
ncbi:DMT family transporter [Halobium salinum]|uniref:DMT family transporter n=1 Tax=Halobium salinum TaxID=1364940 RepID=A0ABD5P911_9EURY|nr:DMT family transporter [Halobium salinum]